MPGQDLADVAGAVVWWIVAGCGAAVLLLGIITTGQWAKATAERTASQITPGGQQAPVGVMKG